MNSLEDDTLVAINLPWQGVVTLIRPVEPATCDWDKNEIKGSTLVFRIFSYKVSC